MKIWSARLRLLHSKLLNQLLPQRCQLCLQTCPSKLAICPDCRRALPEFSTQQPGNLLQCPELAQQFKQIHFEQLISLAPYGWPFKAWISKLKFRRQFQYASLMGQLLAQKIAANPLPKPQILMPMPLHPIRYWQRGYNQAELIAQPLAQQLQLPLDCHSLKRIRHTKAQSSLQRAQRSDNVKQAFAYCANGNYQHIGLVDDVLTTAASINQLCILLKAAGVAKISVYTICISCSH